MDLEFRFSDELLDKEDMRQEQAEYYVKRDLQKAVTEIINSAVDDPKWKVFNTLKYVDDETFMDMVQDCLSTSYLYNTTIYPPQCPPPTLKAENCPP